jgi:branched-chain amino acid transport system permease protein
VNNPVVRNPRAFRSVLVVAGLAMAAAGAWLPSYYVGLLIDGLIFSIFALSLNLLVGYTGLPSLGHAAYFAVGAYAAGLMSVHVTSNFFAGALAGIVAGTLLAATFGLLALRAAGVYFLMITLALAQIAWGVALTWREVTGGDDGLRGVSRPTLGFVNIDLIDTSRFYLFALICFVAAFVLVRALLLSPFGRSLLGIQSNAGRMNALGYHVWLHKYIIFVISGAFAGFAGVLFVQYKGFVSPEAASILVSAEVMLMVIIGGAATLAGPVLGAFIIILLSNFISAYTAHWTFVLGALYAIVMLLAPDGIVGEIKNAIRRRERAS